MRWSSAVAVLALALSPVSSAATEKSGLTVPFLQGKPFAELLKKARAENKPLMIDMYAVWCGPCKLMDRTTFSDPAVGDWAKRNVIPVKIDAEKGEGRKLAQRYMVVVVSDRPLHRPDRSGDRPPRRGLPARAVPLGGGRGRRRDLAAPDGAEGAPEEVGSRGRGAGRQRPRAAAQHGSPPPARRPLRHRERRRLARHGAPAPDAPRGPRGLRGQAEPRDGRPRRDLPVPRREATRGGARWPSSSGASRSAAGRPAAAKKTATSALTALGDSSPYAPELWAIVGAAEKKAGKSDAAIAACRRAVTLAEAAGVPPSARGEKQMALAELLADAGKADEARAALKAALERWPNDPEAWRRAAQRRAGPQGAGEGRRVRAPRGRPLAGRGCRRAGGARRGARRVRRRHRRRDRVEARRRVGAGQRGLPEERLVREAAGQALLNPLARLLLTSTSLVPDTPESRARRRRSKPPSPRGCARRRGRAASSRPSSTTGIRAEPARLVAHAACTRPPGLPVDAPLPARQGGLRRRVAAGRRPGRAPRLQRPRPGASRSPAVGRRSDHVRLPRAGRHRAPRRGGLAKVRARPRARRRRRLLDGGARCAPRRGFEPARPGALALGPVRRPAGHGGPVSSPRHAPPALAGGGSGPARRCRAREREPGSRWPTSTPSPRRGASPVRRRSSTARTTSSSRPLPLRRSTRRSAARRTLWLVPRCGHCHHADEPSGLRTAEYRRRWSRFFSRALPPR